MSEQTLSNPRATPAPSAVSRGVFALILVAFVASGAAGLMYEVVWFRSLTYVFGATQLAVSTVLASFMGGLALGSWLLGAASDRMRRPLRVYAMLEVGIAIGGLSVPWLLRLVEPIGHVAYENIASSSGFAALAMIRFVCVVFVLLLPTTLMGATVPVMSRFLVIRGESLGLKVGSLYAANTFGAVAGAFVAGFALIATVGITKTLWCAAGLNIAAAITTALLAARVERPSNRADAAEAPALPGGKSKRSIDGPENASPAADFSPRLARLALWTYGVSGFVSLSYQVVWTRGMLFCAEGTTFTFSAILTVFLTGLAIGSALAARPADKSRSPASSYAWLLLLLALTGGASAIMLFEVAPFLVIADAGSAVARGPFIGTMINRFARTACVVGAPTLVMGMLFPFAVKLAVHEAKRVGGGVGRVYAFNTVGCILGAFAAGFVLLPALGMARTLLLLATLSAASAVLVAYAGAASRVHKHAMLVAAIALIAAQAAYLAPSGRLTFQTVISEDLPYQVLAWREGSMDTVTITENAIGTRKIFVDNVPVAGTDRVILTDQKSLAHLPVLIGKSPTSALTVGFGSGGASYSYTLYKELTRVRCVEISTNVLQPDIQRLLAASNHGLLDRMPQLPQYGIILDDARSYLRFTRDSYDSIATDCTDLRYKSNANLYDLEYFRLCRERLTDDGMVVVWMPIGGLSEDLFLVALNTFAHVFGEQTHVWYQNNEMIHYVLLVGTKKPLSIDYRKAVERIGRPEVKADLAEIGLADADKMLAGYVTGGKPLLSILAGRRLNTEDHPIIEFEGGRSVPNPRQIWGNLERLYTDRQSVVSLIDPSTLPDAARQRIQRIEAAAPLVARGLEAMHVDVDLAKAAKRFGEARNLAPDDPVLDYLCEFVFYRQVLASVRQSNDPELLYKLGLADTVNSEIEDPKRSGEYLLRAAQQFQRAAQVTDIRRGFVSGEQSELWANAVRRLVWCLDRLGKKDDAKAVLEQARAVVPKFDPTIRD